MDRHVHPNKPKSLSLGVVFQFFEYLGFEFGFEYFANLLQISHKIIQIKKKQLVFEYGLEYQFDFFLIFKIVTQIHTKKITLSFGEFLTLDFALSLCGVLRINYHKL